MTKTPTDSKSPELPEREGRPRPWEDMPETGSVRVDPLPSPHETVPCLVIVAGTQLGQVYQMKGDRAVIGRDESAELSIREASISRRHAMVYRDDEAFCRIKDLGSRNGTFVNGRRIQDVVLTATDRVQIGKTVVIKFEYHSTLETQFHAHLYEAGVLDALTGVYNRRYFDGHLVADFHLCVRHGEPLSLMIADLDHFKQINDNHGQPAGDAVLRQAAALIGSRVRAEDILARYGGDEFGIILRRTNPDGARTLAEALRGLVEQTELICKETALHLTITVGVATWVPGCAYRASSDLLKAAVDGLYRAKARGVNCVETDDVE